MLLGSCWAPELASKEHQDGEDIHQRALMFIPAPPCISLKCFMRRSRPVSF
ncbi:MAG: hypothetical protein MZV65_53400 [Chromatiales bacterium]|nr:hypothetical protein [Chromatiales bacterium]